MNKFENTAKVIQEIGSQKKGCFLAILDQIMRQKEIELDFVYVSEFSEWEEGRQISKSIIENFLV